MSRSQSAELDRIRGGAPERRPNVRGLATQAELSKCGVASLAFGLGVNADRLLEGTSMVVPFGQSQFAFARGAQFERYLIRNDCAVLFGALREDLGFGLTDAEVVDLRTQFAPNLPGLRARAARTRQVIEAVLEGDPSAPNLIIGAVFETSIAGMTAYLEADAVAARDAGGTTIYTGKSRASRSSMAASTRRSWARPLTRSLCISGCSAPWSSSLVVIQPSSTPRLSLSPQSTWDSVPKSPR